jgi:hypothetical protein
MKSEYAKQVERIRELFYYPFACQSVVDAHGQCLRGQSWRECEPARAAMDDCIEVGEKQRFHIHSVCSRLKRQHQSCLMQNDSDCAAQLAKLHTCAVDASEDFKSRRKLQQAAAAGQQKG